MNLQISTDNFYGSITHCKNQSQAGINQSNHRHGCSKDQERIPAKDLPSLPTPLRMAQEMGTGLGEREVLLREM
jgi:hypothetical protein